MSIKLFLTLPTRSRPRHNRHVTTAHAHLSPAHVRTFGSPVHSGPRGRSRSSQSMLRPVCCHVQDAVKKAWFASNLTILFFPTSTTLLQLLASSSNYHNKQSNKSRSNPRQQTTYTAVHTGRPSPQTTFRHFMDSVPFIWRARNGYIPPFPAPAASIPLPPAAPTPLAVMSTQYVCVPQPQPLAYAAPIYQAASTASSKSCSSHSPKPAPNEPPHTRAGMNYMFPAEHTKLHIFNKSSKVWEVKHAGKSLNFKIFNVATTFTPAMVIENVLSGKAAPKGWAITEVVERGDGAWAKGTTIDYGGDRAGAALSSLGWTAKRGESLPPVWVVVHKA